MNRHKHIGPWKIRNSYLIPSVGEGIELFEYTRFNRNGEEVGRVIEEAIQIDEPCGFLGFGTKKVWKKYSRWRASVNIYGNYTEADTVEEGLAKVDEALIKQGYIIIPERLLVME